MLTAIDFDDDFVSMGKKVGDLAPNRRLTSKLSVRKTATYSAPEFLFGIGGVFTKFACPLDCTGRCGVIAFHALTLSRLRRSFPLPPGEGGARREAVGG
ncbi:hypothetical protein AAW01_06995 [Aurantiacibacter gangjinensis]|uniref:Uncharacterized protein n=1 Tax=Aurantiacibacter gangjinensis TaxID=502682 RepID=A0A0G9ML60_9SPHN|nr:hypothetical protein AAW01_06995 [Aurantiacibacter gangjinensis]